MQHNLWDICMCGHPVTKHLPLNFKMDALVWDTRFNQHHEKLVQCHESGCACGAFNPHPAKDNRGILRWAFDRFFSFK